MKGYLERLMSRLVFASVGTTIYCAAFAGMVMYLTFRLLRWFARQMLKALTCFVHWSFGIASAQTVGAGSPYREARVEPPARPPSWLRRHWFAVLAMCVCAYLVYRRIDFRQGEQVYVDAAEAPIISWSPSAFPQRCPVISITYEGPTIEPWRRPRARPPTFRANTRHCVGFRCSR